MSFVGVVAGATGATGRWIVECLINEPRCEEVIALSRSGNTNFQDSKVRMVVTDWSTPLDLPKKQLIGFCALGSAPYSEEADFVIPKLFGESMKSAGCESMFLVSASNAKAGSWIGYSDTIGRREEAFKAMGFDRLGIYRPGMMERQEKARFKEKFFSMFIPKIWTIDTKKIAQCMVQGALAMPKGVHVFSMSEMKSVL